MNFNEFCIKVSKAPRGQSRGMFAMQTLQQNYPALAIKIKNLELSGEDSLDPSIDNNRMPKFLAWCKKNW
jgi:hypothetical protein